MTQWLIGILGVLKILPEKLFISIYWLPGNVIERDVLIINVQMSEGKKHDKEEWINKPKKQCIVRCLYHSFWATKS